MSYRRSGIPALDIPLSIYFFLVLTFGLVTNGLVIVVFAKGLKKIVDRVFYYSVIALEVFDSLTLFTFVGRYCLRQAIDFDPRDFHFTCKTHEAFGSTCQYTSNTILFFITVRRVGSLLWPIHLNIVANNKCVLGIIICAIPIMPIAFSVKYVVGSSLVAGRGCEYNPQKYSTQNTLKVVLFVLIPTVVIFSLFSLFYCQKRRLVRTVTALQPDESAKRNVLCFMFLAFYQFLSSGIYSIYEIMLQEPIQRRTNITAGLFRSVDYTISCTGFIAHATNFVGFMLFSNQFRLAFYRVKEYFRVHYLHQQPFDLTGEKSTLGGRFEANTPLGTTPILTSSVYAFTTTASTRVGETETTYILKSCADTDPNYFHLMPPLMSPTPQRK